MGDVPLPAEQPEHEEARRLAEAAQEWADGKSVMFDTDVALVEAINDVLALLSKVEQEREKDAEAIEAYRSERDWLDAKLTAAERELERLRERMEALCASAVDLVLVSEIRAALSADTQREDG